MGLCVWMTPLPPAGSTSTMATTPTRGGKRPGSGRRLGVPNKATAERKDCARKFGSAAIDRLVKLAGITPGGKGKAQSELAQVAACREILDLAFGLPEQP